MEINQRVRIISTGFHGVVVSKYYLKHLGGVTVKAGHPNWPTELLQWVLIGDLRTATDSKLSLMEDLELIIGALK